MTPRIVSSERRLRRGYLGQKEVLWAAALALAPRAATADPAADYAEHCASCHAEDRLGGTGPALIPETLGRVKGLDEVIADHRNLLNAIERCDLAAFEPLVERHLYGGIRRLGSKLTEEYADFFEPETVK